MFSQGKKTTEKCNCNKVTMQKIKEIEIFALEGLLNQWVKMSVEQAV